MKTTLFMAASANGYVAGLDGNEDFLPHDGWVTILNIVNEFGHVIWGRTTYEAVKQWGDQYLNDLKDAEIVVISKSKLSYPQANVTVCASPEDALRYLKNKGFSKAFLSGGPTLNSAFLKAGLVDEIILNINPVLVGDGLGIFAKDDFELKLQLTNVKELSSSIVQLHYMVEN